jgi:sugar lactone lactonase YvrE
MRPHNVVIDKDDNIYVADRENHRVQVFNSRGELQTIWQNIHRPDGICLGADGKFYVGELGAIPGLEDAPGFGHRVSIYDLQGNRLALFGDPIWGDGPGQFIAPHGIAVDSRGDIYVGEASYTMKGKFMDPPRELRSFQKLALKR